MNKEQKQAMIIELIENSTWGDFEDFSEFAADENEELMNELETTFGDDWHEFGGWLMHRLVEVIPIEELIVAMNIQAEFDIASSKLHEFSVFALKMNPKFDNMLDEIWNGFYETAVLKPTTCIEKALGKLCQI